MTGDPQTVSANKLFLPGRAALCPSALDHTAPDLLTKIPYDVGNGFAIGAGALRIEAQALKWWNRLLAAMPRP